MADIKSVLHRTDIEPLIDGRGKISETHLCIDCGFNTAPGIPSRFEFDVLFALGSKVVQTSVSSDTKMYMVNDKVWAKTGLDGYGGCLCIGCLEKRIGRRLKPKDFDRDHPFNKMPGTPRLRDRRGC